MSETGTPRGVPDGWIKVPGGAAVRAGSPYAICYGDWHVVIYPGHDEDWVATGEAPAYYASEPPIAPIPDDAQYLIVNTAGRTGLLLRRDGSCWYDHCFGEVIGEGEIVSYQVLTVGARLDAPSPKSKPESNNPGYRPVGKLGDDRVWCDCDGCRALERVTD